MNERSWNAQFFAQNILFRVCLPMLIMISIFCPGSVFANKNTDQHKFFWRPLQNTACDNPNKIKNTHTVTFNGILDDAVRRQMYELVQELNCENSKKSLVIKYDLSTDRVLMIINGKQRFVGRPWDFEWQAPKDSDVIIVSKNYMNTTGIFGFKAFINDFIRQHTKSNEELYENARMLYNNESKCRYVVNYKNRNYKIIAVDAELNRSDMKSCLNNLYK